MNVKNIVATRSFDYFLFIALQFHLFSVLKLNTVNDRHSQALLNGVFQVFVVDAKPLFFSMLHHLELGMPVFTRKKLFQLSFQKAVTKNSVIAVFERKQRKMETKWQSVIFAAACSRSVSITHLIINKAAMDLLKSNFWKRKN